MQSLAVSSFRGPHRDPDPNRDRSALAYVQYTRYHIFLFKRHNERFNSKSTLLILLQAHVRAAFQCPAVPAPPLLTAITTLFPDPVQARSAIGGLFETPPAGTVGAGELAGALNAALEPFYAQVCPARTSFISRFSSNAVSMSRNRFYLFILMDYVFVTVFLLRFVLVRC